MNAYIDSKINAKDEFVIITTIFAQLTLYPRAKMYASVDIEMELFILIFLTDFDHIWYLMF